MAIVAELCTDKEVGAPRIRRSVDGWTGTRRYWVNTHDEDRALLAAGVPLEGEPWSALLPDLKCRSVEVEYDCGRDDITAEPPEDGWCLVTAEYATDGLEVLPAPLVGTKFTRIGYRDLTVTEDFDAVGTLDPVKPPDGAEIEQGMLVARVYVYVARSEVIDLGRLAALTRNKNTNSQAVQLPPLVGNTAPGGGPLFQALELRYLGFEYDARPNSLELIHELACAPDHFLEWWRRDSKGARIGEAVFSQMYEPASLAGLW